VFVLRSVLGLEEELVGEIVEIPMQEVRRIWMKALLKLREVLPREFFPRSAQ
jgi:DNA-directed RNA polymerase specialized sigma24 family protein